MANSSSIENAGTGDAVTGTFLGLAEGAQIANFLGSGRSATLSYIGGDGHDVTLTGHGLFVSLDGAGNLVLTYNAGMDDAVTIQAAPATVESVITHATELIGNQVAPFTGTGTMVARVPFTAVTETQISANFDAGKDASTDNKDASVNDCNDVDSVNLVNSLFVDLAEL